MISFLRKSVSLISSPCFNPKNPIFLLQFFSSASKTLNPSPKSNAIADYLITSYGFSPQKAAAASRCLARRRFPPNPDSLRNFLKHIGFTDANIRTCISNDPSILLADVDKTLKPNLETLSESVNLSGSDLGRFVVSNPRVLTAPTAFPRLEFWKTLLNNDTKKLLKVFTRNPGLISQDIDSSTTPKLALLKSYGVSQTKIEMILVRGYGFFRKSTAAMEMSLKKVEELGFVRGSSMYILGLVSLGRIGADVFKTKMEIFKSFGWSETMFFAAIKNAPTVVCLSEQNIREKMEFLMVKAGCTQSYIASHPTILGFSLEKRLMPRSQVLKILKSNELVRKDWDMYSLMCLSEREFLERIILRYKGLVPNLHETYNAACADQISISLIPEVR